MNVRRLLPLLLLAACAGDPTAIGPVDVLMTVWVDQSAVSPAQNVRLHLENRGDGTAYVVDYCGDRVVPQLERRQGEQWVPEPADIGGCLTVATPPVEIEPGETAGRSIALYDPGQYRSTVRVTSGPGDEAVALRHEFIIGS